MSLRFLKFCQCNRDRLGLCLIVSFLLFISPSQALCDERIDRIEKMLELMQHKIDALSLENRQLKEKVQLMETASRHSDGIMQATTPPPPASFKARTSDRSTGSLAVAAGAKKTITTTVKKTESVEDAADEAFNMDVFQERIRGLEAGQEELTTRLDSSVKVRGYASVEYGINDQQAQNSGFRLHHFSLLFSKAIQKDWQLFSEIEFEDAPFIEAIHANPNNNGTSTVQGKFLIEQMYIKYHPSVRWDISAGRFLTPFGIWNVYHYAPYVPTQRRPLMIRSLFPVFSDGLKLRYASNPDFGLIDSQFYITNGAGNPGRLDRNVSKAVGGKINIAPTFWQDLNFGASLYRDKDNLNVIRTIYGLHLNGHYRNAGFQAEFSHRMNKPLNAVSFRDVSAYTQSSCPI